MMNKKGFFEKLQHNFISIVLEKSDDKIMNFHDFRDLIAEEIISLLPSDNKNTPNYHSFASLLPDLGSLYHDTIITSNSFTSHSDKTAEDQNIKNIVQILDKVFLLGLDYSNLLNGIINDHYLFESYLETLFPDSLIDKEETSYYYDKCKSLNSRESKIFKNEKGFAYFHKADSGQCEWVNNYDNYFNSDSNLLNFLNKIYESKISSSQDLQKNLMSLIYDTFPYIWTEEVKEELGDKLAASGKEISWKGDNNTGVFGDPKGRFYKESDPEIVERFIDTYQEVNRLNLDEPHIEL